jgi:hypothetical protein
VAKREINYGDLAVIRKDPVELPSEPSPAPPMEEKLVNVAQSVVVYMSSAFHKELMRYAVEHSEHRNRVKVHDLILEALQMWADSKGIAHQARAKPKPIR